MRFWENKDKNYVLEFYFDKLEFNEFSLDLPFFNKKEKVGKIIRNNDKKSNKYKDLKYNKNKRILLLKNKKDNFKLL